MQYWVFFHAGVGGDGFANLLEHADNIVPIDNKKLWRKQWTVNGRVKFYGPHWVLGQFKPFRRYNITDYQLNPHYIELVDSNQHTVVAAHYHYWNEIERFPDRNIIEKNQIKIHVYSTNYNRILEDFSIKTHSKIVDKSQWIQTCKSNVESNLKNSNYHIHINIDQAWNDWAYLQTQLDQLDIQLDKIHYNTYLSIINNSELTE